MALAIDTSIPPSAPPPHHTASSKPLVAEQEQIDQQDTRDHRSESPPTLPRPPVSPISPSASVAELPVLPAPISDPEPLKLPAKKIKSPKKSQVKSQSNDQQPISQTRPQAPPQAPRPPPQTEFIDQPKPVSLEEEDNTDAAALRAAISILQIQKEKSRRDIKTLQNLRGGLIKDPDNFTQELLAGRLREEKLPNDPLQATFNRANEDDDDQEDTETMDDETSVAGATKQSSLPSRYPKIPAAQNVIRCPPINWTKYHIAGEPLDRMHEEQRKRPTLGDPARDSSQQHFSFGVPSASPAGEHQIFAPYDPMRDRSATAAEQMGIGVQTRRSSKKPEAGGAWH